MSSSSFETKVVTPLNSYLIRIVCLAFILDFGFWILSWTLSCICLVQDKIQKSKSKTYPIQTKFNNQNPRQNPRQMKDKSKKKNQKIKIQDRSKTNPRQSPKVKIQDNPRQSPKIII